MQRRDTLKTISGIALAGLLGIGASGTVAGGNHESARRGQKPNPGKVATYNGKNSKVASGLGGFDRVLVYLANPGPDTGEEVSPQRFQEEIMGRSTEEVVADRNAAIEYFDEMWGLEFPEADEDTVYDTVQSDGDIDARLEASMLDPATGYTAYMISGRSMPNNHGEDHTNTNTELTGHVRDGSWQARLNEPSEFGGSYEGDPGRVFPENTMVIWGDYNIRMGDQEDPIVIHFEAAHPIGPFDISDIPGAFNCRIEHEEWGEGIVRGVTGGDMVGIRNVLTFPASL